MAGLVFAEQSDPGGVSVFLVSGQQQELLEAVDGDATAGDGAKEIADVVCDAGFMHQVGVDFFGGDDLVAVLSLPASYSLSGLTPFTQYTK